MSDHNEMIFSLPIQKSYEESGEWIIEGFVSTDEVDSEKFRMTKPALEDLVRDAKVLSTVLHNHLSDEAIGVIREAKVTLVQKNPEIWGAWVKILISKTVPEIWQKIQENVLSKFSIKGSADAELVTKNGQTISEAYAYRGAEVSIVSVPGLKTARILSHYVSKMQKGGFPMPAENLEKITLDAAKGALKDLLELEDTKWSEVEKILDLVEVEKANPDPDSNDDEEQADDVEKAWGAAMNKVLAGLKKLTEKVEDDLKKQVEDLVSLVETVISEYPKPAKKNEEDEEEEDEEEDDEELEKSEKLAEGIVKDLETKIGELPEANRAAFSAVMDALATLSKPVEKKKKEEEEEKLTGASSDEAVQKMAQTLDKVQKSITDATQKIESEQIVQMAETVVTLNAEVEKLSEIMAKKVPIRKGLSHEEKRRVEVKKAFSEDEEYQELPAREKLAHLFGAIEGV